MGLARRAVSGTAWVAAGTYVNQLVNFAVGVWLMRLIAPELFGVFALAFFFMGLAKRVGGFGFNHALVHRQTDLERAVPTHLLLHLAVSLLSLALVGAASPVLRAVYDSGDRLVTVLLALTVLSLLEDASHTPRILLEKQLRFRRVMLLATTATGLSSAAARAAAYGGAGVWALVARYGVSVGVGFVGYWILSPVRFRVRFDPEMIRWFLRFGGYLWVAGLATFAILELDDYLVGTMVGALALGYYNRAYRFASLPTDAVGSVVSRVAFPLYSRLQDDRARLSRAFRVILRGIFAVCLPLAVLLALVARPLTDALVGPAWRPMVPLLQLLVVYAGLRPVYATTGELFVAVGRPRIPGQILLAQAVLLAVICPLGIRAAGAAGAAVSVGLVLLVGVGVAYGKARRFVDVRYRRVFAGPLAAASASAAASVLLYPRTDTGTPWLDLPLRAAIFLGGYGLALLVLEGRTLRREWAFLRDRLREAAGG